MKNDIRNLSKWLNEEQEAPIDRQALARVLAMAEQPARLPFVVGGGLVAIKTLLSRDPCVHANTAIQMIDAILAEQPAQQEPVAWMVDVDLANYQGQSEYRTILAWNAKPVWSGTHEINEVLESVPLYTSTPAQRTWFGLTDADLETAMEGAIDKWDIAEAIEAKLKEKNK